MSAFFDEKETTMRRLLNDLHVFDLIWDGPFTLEQVLATTGGHECGIYAVYGTHNVMGTDALLYLGAAESS